ncbi:hypothetical protein ABT264_19510 [Streptomyces virginiae]|uniref:hypothetical protein n=1 Tax=Streptomyces virginiae TaxID=1961 RepID=UPI003324ADDE
MSLSQLRTDFREARQGLHGWQVMNVSEVRAILSGLEQSAVTAVCAENTRGGEARSAVAAVAQALDVDIDEGPGHRWDTDHMRRVVSAAETAVTERNEAREQRDAWKTAMEQMDAKRVLPLQRELREEREKSAAQAAELRALRSARLQRPPSLIFHTTTAEEHTTTDEELQRLAESVVMRAPLDSLVSDLKNVIVSQAREIARLKGEGA